MPNNNHKDKIKGFLNALIELLSGVILLGTIKTTICIIEKEFLVSGFEKELFFERFLK